jgi:hypothetical protein
MQTIPFVARPPVRHPLDVELRATLEAGYVALAIAQSDAALQGRAIPEQLSNLHPIERDKFIDAALVALMIVNRDAELYAEQEAGKAAFEELDAFCRQYGMDWRDIDSPLHSGDAFESFVYRAAAKAVKRFRQVCYGGYPGLSTYLAKLRTQRMTDGDPQLAKEGL